MKNITNIHCQNTRNTSEKRAGEQRSFAGPFQNLRTTENLENQAYFIDKVTALTNGQCYPNNAHPQRMYCKADGTSELPATGTLDRPQRIYFLSQLSSAVGELLLEIFS